MIRPHLLRICWPAWGIRQAPYRLRSPPLTRWIQGTAGSQAEGHRQQADGLGNELLGREPIRRMEEGIAPTLLDDPSRYGSHGKGPVRAGRPRGREAVRKGRQPNPGLPVTRLHLDPTVDRWRGSGVPDLKAHRLNWLRRRKAKPCLAARRPPSNVHQGSWGCSLGQQIGSEP